MVPYYIAYRHVASGLQYLNSNCTLYHAVVKAEKDHHLLSEEAQRAAHYLRIDLEKGGIHLSPGNDCFSNYLNYLFLLHLLKIPSFLDRKIGSS